MNSNWQQIYALVRNAIVAFLIFIALESLVALVNWQKVNWEVVGPTALSLAASLGIWGADRFRAYQERKQALLIQARLEKDNELKQSQQANFDRIQAIEESLDSIVISLSALEAGLVESKNIDNRTIDRLSELETDLETHRDRWAHKGAEDAIQELRQSLYKLSAQVEVLAGMLETQKRIDIVAQSVNNVNAQVERLRHIVRELPVSLDESGASEERQGLDSQQP